MTEVSSELDHDKSQTSDEKGKITCHLVSLPKVILHRIDENTIESFKKPNSSLKKPVKRLTPKPSKASPVKSTFSNTHSEKNNMKPGKNRFKKENNFGFKSAKLQKKIAGGKLESLSKAITKGLPKHAIKLQSSPVKNMLNKTMLQKKSKIAIPPPKKSKSIPTKSTKPTPPKPKSITPVKKQNKLSAAKTKIKTLRRDSESGDEFLYDELMDQIESTDNKRSELHSGLERTASITLKPNIGNKPPTVVKGGIIKKSNLPADLKPVTTPNNLNSSRVSKNISASVNTGKSTSSRKNIKPPRKSLSPPPAKKASPWPIAISSPSKDPQTSNLKPNKKLGPKSKITSSAGKISPSPKSTEPIVPSTPISNLPSLIPFEDKPIVFNTVKPKMGPKKTATVIPHMKSQDVDDNMSDEYTEEERLENIEPDPVETVKSTNIQNKDIKHAAQSNSKVITHNKPTPPSYDISKDDEDPHLDLLRILTDDSEEPTQAPPSSPMKPAKPSPTKDVNTSVDDSINEDSNTNDSMNSTLNQTNETVNGEPAPRTIYDLMNEISLQYPSWNLHILPESNAFCIAQVTKGRLGLPTLKKCIELDPNDFHAKVYIHQYHIKRFDGVYDSEERIVALIEEINSIKA